jgi:hypothetical protein
VIGSIGWITGTSCEHPGVCYPTRVALTCAADETYAWSCVAVGFPGIAVRSGAKMKVFGADSAPRPMKMGTIASPWRHEFVLNTALQPACVCRGSPGMLHREPAVHTLRTVLRFHSRALTAPNPGLRRAN